MFESLTANKLSNMRYDSECSSVDELEVDILELKKEMQRLRGILNHNFEIINQIRTTRKKYNTYNVQDIENTDELL